ncbi:uncharacterized protein LOC133825397 [Humulus lupulus]|uniref:uncharacterized protein LOC133825397 n=1 Tax=Humulus lupulus TaxID=3486 RepID=UPI002B402C5E|nr:uncharacterized protein LOC133825397 [Humulus lupulus]
MTPYEGTTNPKYHLHAFNDLMKLKGINSRARYHCFAITLKGATYKWFKRLRSGTIRSWQQFSDEFLQQHHAVCDNTISSTSLANIKQGEGESLKSYIHRFNMEVAKVGSLSRGEFKMEITAGVRSGSKLLDNMLKTEATDLDEFYEIAQKYIRIEDSHENLMAGRNELLSNPTPHEGSNDVKKKRAYKGLRNDQQRKPIRGGEPRKTPYTFYTDLTDTREHIIIANENHVLFKRPPPMKRDRSKRDPSKYCQYHKDVGHTRAECNHLKVEIEELIHRGQLGRYVRRENPRKEDRPSSPQAREQALEVQAEVRTIFKDPTFVGESSKGRSTYAKEYFAYNNPLVLTIHIANMKVHQVLVDNGSSVDILYCLSLGKMGLGIRNLRPCHTSLYGFTEDSIQPLGTIDLALTMGEQPKQTTVMSNFVVVSCALAFNAVFGRPSLRELKAVTLIYHLSVIFPTLGVIESIKRQQKEARECYNTSLRTSINPQGPMAMVIHREPNPQGLDLQVTEEIRTELDERERQMSYTYKNQKLEEMV